MPNFAILTVSDVEGQNAIYPVSYSAPNVVSEYASIDIIFPNIVGSAGEEDMSASDYSEVHSYTYGAGWQFFSISIDVDGAYDGSDGTFVSSKSVSDVLSAQESYAGNIIIVKNNLGAAYLPEWGFNGIGDFVNGQGYQIKLESEQTFTFKGNPLSVADADGNRAYGAVVPLLSNWSMIGNPLPAVDPNTGEVFEHPTWPQVLDGATNSDYDDVPYLSNDFTVHGSLIIVKDYMGNCYLPEWGFDGIGPMIAGQSYQIKLVMGDVATGGSIEITM